MMNLSLRCEFTNSPGVHVLTFVQDAYMEKVRNGFKRSGPLNILVTDQVGPAKIHDHFQGKDGLTILVSESSEDVPPRVIVSTPADLEKNINAAFQAL